MARLCRKCGQDELVDLGDVNQDVHDIPAPPGGFDDKPPEGANKVQSWVVDWADWARQTIKALSWRVLQLIFYAWFLTIFLWFIVRWVSAWLVWLTFMRVSPLAVAETMIPYAKIIFPPEPPEAPSTIEQVKNWTISAMMSWMVVDIFYLLWIVVAIVATTSVYFLMVPAMRSASYFIQGYKCESMQPGSALSKGTHPKFQVAILEPGIFGATHLGYGLRMGEWLVLPVHVRAGRNEIILEGSTGKLLVSQPVLASRLIADLEYMRIEEQQWSRIGVTKAGRSPLMVSGLATCSGLGLMSTGKLRKTPALGMLSYHGSTKDGMSGAAYVSSGRLVGMHLGATQDFNTGVSAEVFSVEIADFYRCEGTGVQYDSLGQAEEAAGNVAGTQKPSTWNLTDIKKRLNTAKEERDLMAGESWADYMEEIDPFDGEAAKNSKRVSLNLPMSCIKIRQQGLDSEDFLVEYASQKMLERVDTLESRVANLEEQVVENTIGLRNLVKEKEEDATSVKCESCKFQCRTQDALDRHMASNHQVERFPCEYCPAVMRTEARRQNHYGCCLKARIAGKYVGESASAADFRKNVRQTPFLGPPRASQRRNKQGSTPTSSTKGELNASPSWGEFQSRMLESQLRIEKFLSALQPATDGLPSGSQPN